MNFVQTEESPYKIKLEIFEGPLDLLLHLIHENEIDIQDIPIAKVTEQYLAYLSLMESLDLDVAGEWLVMAATLLEIKSRMLLPEEPKAEDGEEPETIDPRLELVERLIEYEKFKQAAELFRERETERQRQFIRGAVQYEFDFRPTLVMEDITATDLLGALQRILSDAGEEEVTTLKRRKITVRIRIREIWRKISEAGRPVIFDELFDDVLTRVEIVITFLALLELLKMQRVKVRQKKTFAPIEITVGQVAG